MALRLDEQVVRGELDNRIKGKVTGTIWLVGRTNPIHLVLEGNSWRDWAGCVLRFVNPEPNETEPVALASEQTGVCGDLTASRRVRLPPEPVVDWIAQGCPGKDTLPWGNSVYLEWFSTANGRVVIESARYRIGVSDRSWCMTEEEEESQRRLNLQAMQHFMLSLQAAIEDTDEAEQSNRTGNDPTADLEAEERASDRALELIFEMEELKRKTRELTGRELSEEEEDQLVPSDVREQFWQNVEAFDSSPQKTRRELLAEDGFRAPAPADLSNEQITTELWRLIEALATRRIFLESTNHLSDRELYTLLVERILEETAGGLSSSAEWHCRICVHEYGLPGDDDGTDLYLRYYADEKTRQQWLEDFAEEIPPHCKPPYDRDQHLPR